MENVVIFNGFETIKFIGTVIGQYTKNTSKWGYVYCLGKTIIVEKIENEWWGRTT